MSRHVVLTYPHSLAVAGGGTVHCVRLALDLRRAGADVTLVPILSASESLWPRPAPPGGDAERAAIERLEAAGVEVHPVPQHPLAWWFDGRAVRRALPTIAERRRIDALLGWWCELAYSTDFAASRGIFCGLIAAAPYSLWWSRGARPRWLQSHMDHRVVAGTARRVSRIFANSHHTASEVVRCLGAEADRIEVVHPPLSGRFSRPSRRLSGRIERLFFFGRLRAEKGVFDLVEALGRLQSEPWRLRVAGMGETERIARIASELGIMHRVTLLGHLPPEELADELERAQVAVLPSYEESFGLSVVESQLAGLPVIAYDAGAVGETCRDGETGWLVPTGDVDRLTDAVREALTDGEETARRGELARESAHRMLGDSPGERILAAVEEWTAVRASDSGGSI